MEDPYSIIENSQNDVDIDFKNNASLNVISQETKEIIYRKWFKSGLRRNYINGGDVAYSFLRLNPQVNIDAPNRRFIEQLLDNIEMESRTQAFGRKRKRNKTRTRNKNKRMQHKTKQKKIKNKKNNENKNVFIFTCVSASLII